MKLSIKKHIPNFLTCLNLLCGCIAIVFTANKQLELASYMVLLGMFFDFTDGMAARLLKVKSEIGKQLDSFSDIVTFGVAPSFIIFQLIHFSLFTMHHSLFTAIVPYFAFLIAIFSSLRLAKFNLDEQQNDNFKGLPTPANALFFISFPLIINNVSHLQNVKHLNNAHSSLFLIILVIIFSYLLVSPLKMFSLKFTNFTWTDNKTRYIFIIISVLLFALLSYIALPLIILLYIIMSLITC